MAQLEDSSLGANAGADHAGPVLEKLMSVVSQLKADQGILQNNLDDLQKQIDLQRLATAELIGRSQASASTVAKFEEVAQKTTFAAEQLEAEIVQVREATARDVAVFRAEMQAEISEICAKYVGKPGGKSASQMIAQQLQAPDSVNKDEFSAIMEARDRALRDQMTQALEAAQTALSRNFLEEHTKLLVEVVEDREKRSEEARLVRSQLDVMSAAMQNSSAPSTASSTCMGLESVGTSTPLDSMREAIQGLRTSVLQANREDDEGSDKQTKPRLLTERGIFDELASVRRDIASCLDAANAAVRLGEHLTTELHVEVDARSADIKSLRSWVSKALEGKSLTEFQLPVEQDSSVSSPAKLVRQTRGSGTELPFTHGFHTWSSQQALVPAGVDSAGLQPPHPVGIMLSGGHVARRPSMPAGERYLANQRRSTGCKSTTSTGSTAQTPIVNGSMVSPRQARLPSPIKNYHVVQRAESIGQAKDIHESLLRRPQGSPLRENPLATTSRQAYPCEGRSVVTSPPQAGSSASIPPGIGVLDSSRLVHERRVGVPLARSISPVQRRTSAG